MCDSNAKSECIPMKLWTLVSEGICERIPNFTRKYYLIAELLIFKYRWQNISVSSTATCLAASLLFNRTTPSPKWPTVSSGTLNSTIPYRSTEQRSCPQGAWDRADVNLWNTRLHRFSSVASQQSWPEPGGSCRSVCIAAGCMTLTSWSHAWSNSGNISTRCSSMKRSGSGIHVFELAFEHMEDILNTDFSYVWYLYSHCRCL